MARVPQLGQFPFGYVGLGFPITESEYAFRTAKVSTGANEPFHMTGATGPETLTGTAEPFHLTGANADESSTGATEV